MSKQESEWGLFQMKHQWPKGDSCYGRWSMMNSLMTLLSSYHLYPLYESPTWMKPWSYIKSIDMRYTGPGFMHGGEQGHEWSHYTCEFKKSHIWLFSALSERRVLTPGFWFGNVPRVTPIRIEVQSLCISQRECRDCHCHTKRQLTWHLDFIWHLWCYIVIHGRS